MREHRRRWMRFCQSVGLASLLLVMNYGGLLGGGADVRMHVPYRLTAIGAAQIADMLLLGAALFALAEVFRRTRYYGWLRAVYLLLIPPWMVSRFEPMFPFEAQQGVVAVLTLAWIACLLLLLLKFPLGYRRVVRLADVAGVFLAVFAACSLLQLLYVMTWRPGTQEIHASWDGRTPRQHRRVVWILFDELSYEQVFEHRAHDVALPNFDALRAESTMYSHVQPIGMKTVKIIPSLFSGHVIDDYRFSFGNTLRVHDADARGFHPLSGEDTVFADAKRAGWRTAIVGWYNPYCTLYGSVLDSCYWDNLDRLDGNMAQQQSWAGNVARPLRDMATQVRSQEILNRQECDFDVEQRSQTHRTLAARAKDLIAEDQADFVFLHLSTPHSPNIWSRIEDRYVHTCGSSYLDNLALADRELGRILQRLRSSSRWKDTTVIVEGDHSWRVMLWDSRPAWTDEDERASREGTFDPRPALLIHDAGQSAAATDARPISLLSVHDALERAIAGGTARVP